MNNKVSMLIAVAGVFLAACESERVTCPSDAPRVTLLPAVKVIAIGETFTPNVQALICGGTTTTPFTGEWRSANATIARVDSTTGTVVGINLGQTVIYAQYFSNAKPVGGTYDSVLVTVR